MLKRIVLAVLILLAPVVGIIVWVDESNPRAKSLGSSMIVLALFYIVILVLLEVVGRSNSNSVRKKLGYLEVTLGADGRGSTGKVVGLVWTLVFAGALVTLSAMVWFGGLSVEESFGGDWDAYLLLLGGPFAAVIAAKGITAAKVDSDGAAKSVTSAASGTALPTATTTSETPKASDLITNDSGETSLVDTQYVIFSLVAIAYFAGSFVRLLVNHADRSCAEGVSTAIDACTQSITLPQIPSALLALTSAAALTYVGNKAVQTSGVRFESLSPNPVAARAAVEMRLVNVTSTATTGNTSVIYYDANSAKATKAPTSVTAADGFTTVVTTAPPAAGDYRVVIVTPDAVSTESQLTVTSQ